MAKDYRGGKRASGGWESDVPDSKDFKFIDSFPDLVGSEKQIKWAESIRDSAAEEIEVYAVYRTSSGGRRDLLDVAEKGKKAIISSIKNSPAVKLTSGEVQKEKIKSQLSGYRDLSQRIGRLNSLFSNSSAKFWIDNRPNQVENFQYKKFKKMIDGK